MPSVLDVACYILNKQRQLTSMKLQKLAYYSQVWSLVWDEEALFPEEFQAWANGPVCRELFDKHRGRFDLSHDSFRFGDSSKLSEKQKETIDVVLQHYGNETGQYLSKLTHLENPWIDARGDSPEGESCTETITKASMDEYYSAL